LLLLFDMLKKEEVLLVYDEQFLSDHLIRDYCQLVFIILDNSNNNNTFK